MNIDLQYKPVKIEVVSTVIEVNGKTAVKSSIYILYKAQNYCSVARSLKRYLPHLDSMLAEETVTFYNRFVMGLTSFNIFIMRICLFIF